MKGKEFESLCMERAKKESDLYAMGRYGVMGIIDPRTKMWRPIASNPDFEGVFGPFGRQFVFDAKVISGTSFEHVSDSTSQVNQREFLLNRWERNVPTFFLVHCKEKVMKTKTHPEMTIAFPTNPAMPIWQEVRNGSVRSINRSILQELGYRVLWGTVNQRDRKSLPNFFAAVLHFAEQIDQPPVEFLL